MTQRNYTIDLLKLLCAVSVVVLHSPTIWRESFLPFTRFAVPCFFMVSGYLLYGGKIERYKKNILHITKIMLWSSLLYAVWLFLFQGWSGFQRCFEGENVLTSLVIGENPLRGHLWYLNSYLIVLLLFTLINKFNMSRWVYIIAPPILLTLNILFGEFNQYTVGDIPVFYTRNWLLLGIPCFLIGGIVKESFSKAKRRSHLLMSAIFVAFALVVYLMELSYTTHFKDLYIGSILLAIGILIASVNISTEESILSKMGSKDSLYIYLLHPIVLDVYSIANGHMPSMWRDIYYLVSPVIIIVTVELMIVTLRKLKIIL